MGGDYSGGRGFKSQHRILDVHFSHYIVGKIVMFVWTDQKTDNDDGGFLT